MKNAPMGGERRTAAMVNWYFPRTLDEAVVYLEREKTIPHGGGTGLLKRGLGGVDGLVDLSRLPLDYLRAEDGQVEIGASRTFAAAARDLGKLLPGTIMEKALGSAASTPLRNRITVGGSVSLLPPWSDLIGPLAVLNGHVVTEGRNGGTFSLPSWLEKSRQFLKGSLVTSVAFPDAAGWLSFYYREVRTAADYPAFTVSILLKKSEGAVREARIAVSGGVDRVVRLGSLEERLAGWETLPGPPPETGSLAAVQFARKPAGSPGYLSEMAALRVRRGLEVLLAGEEGGA